MPEELEQFTELYLTLVKFIVEYSFQLLGAFVVFIIGILVLEIPFPQREILIKD